MIDHSQAFAYRTELPQERASDAALYGQVGIHATQLFAYSSRNLALHHRFNGVRPLRQPNDLSLHIIKRLLLTKPNSKPKG